MLIVVFKLGDQDYGVDASNLINTYAHRCLQIG